MTQKQFICVQLTHHPLQRPLQTIVSNIRITPFLTPVFTAVQGLREKFLRGYEGRYRVSKSLRAPNLRKIFYSYGKLKKKYKRSSLKLSPIFCPKIGEEQKKKDLHSNLVPFFAQNLMKSKKKGLHSNLVQFFAQK